MTAYFVTYETKSDRWTNALENELALYWHLKISDNCYLIESRLSVKKLKKRFDEFFAGQPSYIQLHTPPLLTIAPVGLPAIEKDEIQMPSSSHFLESAYGRSPKGMLRNPIKFIGFLLTIPLAIMFMGGNPRLDLNLETIAILTGCSMLGGLWFGGKEAYEFFRVRKARHAVFLETGRRD